MSDIEVTTEIVVQARAACRTCKRSIGRHIRLSEAEVVAALFDALVATKLRAFNEVNDELRSRGWRVAPQDPRGSDYPGEVLRCGRCLDPEASR